MQVVALPDPKTAPTLFAGIDGLAERLERPVQEAFAIYERGAPELHAIRDEPDAPPRREAEAIDASLAALVTRRSSRSESRPQTARSPAMIDLNTWQALRHQSLGPAEAATP